MEDLKAPFLFEQREAEVIVDVTDGGVEANGVVDRSPASGGVEVPENPLEFIGSDFPPLPYFNQILTAVHEVLDDSDSSIREIAISLIVEMLNNQKEAIEDSLEIIVEKLLHATKDVVAKVSNEAHQCLTVVLPQYDPIRCLTVVVPLLVNADEKTLVTCINYLTKLMGLLLEELMSQLPSFLLALFDAFGNQSSDVQKSVVFCLVAIYIKLDKVFVPYLERLSSTQLKLVTIYANRISQARFGAVMDGNHG